jgi:hypothetical protein
MEGVGGAQMNRPVVTWRILSIRSQYFLFFSLDIHNQL